MGLLSAFFGGSPKQNAIALFYEEIGGKSDQPTDSMGLVDALLEEDILYVWDWKETAEDVVEGVQHLLSHKGLVAINNAQQQRILARQQEKAEDVLPLALEEANQILLASGYRLLAIDTRSDQYCACLVSEDIYNRWVNVRVAPDFFTRDHHRGGGRAPKETQPRTLN